MTLEEVYRPIMPALGQVDAELRSRINGQLDVFASGKRLRPALTLFTAHAVDGDVSPSVTTVASAIEMIHTASLIHDDVIDDSPRRRELPAVFSVIGVKPAIVFADYLFMQALTMFATVDHSGVLPLVIQGINTMCEGQWLEIKVGNRRDCSEDEYFEIVAKKTASLFACSARAGGLLRGARGEELESVESFGRNLGFVYQLRDDAHDLADPGPGPLERQLTRWGGVEYLNRALDGYRKRALVDAARIPDKSERENLVRLLEFISEVS